MCGIQILEQAYRCSVCGTLAEDEAAAQACCDGVGVLGYACPICGQSFLDERMAVTCCDWNRTPEGARTIRLRLEEAGQLPLEL